MPLLIRLLRRPTFSSATQSAKRCPHSANYAQSAPNNLSSFHARNDPTVNTAFPRAGGVQYTATGPPNNGNPKIGIDVNKRRHAKELPKCEDGILKVLQGPEWRTVSGRWLRDNCTCSQCRNEQTGQRQINLFKTPLAGKVERCESSGYGGAASFDITFADGHRSVFPVTFLHNRGTTIQNRQREGRTKLQLFRADIQSNPPTVEYEDVQAGPGMSKLLAEIRARGFCFVDNMPATPEATEAILEQIGPIRNTHYGGFYDFTSDLSSKDTAYTNESLEPHTDTTYFTDPIGLQALHMLSHTDGSGGLSSLVDGFAAASELYERNRRAYHILSFTGVYAHASGNEGISIQPSGAHPVLTHNSVYGHLTHVRWNNADRAGLEVSMGQPVERWYDAAAEFDAILSNTENQYWFQLKPGKMLLFDNWRVLHGRSAFTGKRRMCGGYINRDDFISKYRMTNLSDNDIKASTVTG